MYVGIDIGSLVSKALVMNDNGVLSHAVIDSRSNLEQSALMALTQALEKAELTPQDIAFTVSTGYGRVSFKKADKEVTELSCHGRGAHYLCPSAQTIIDIGGQDSKVLRINSDGNMIDFAMNDKCAAGTGRFLEVMAHTLDISLAEMGKFSFRADNPLKISSTCTVFAETEVISFLASNQRKENIAAGIHAAIACRVGNMAKSFGIKKDVVFVGGVAKNEGIRKCLEEFLEVEFPRLPFDPQLTGALGAALLARDFHQEGIDL
jgi:predicted CoA-substrate-specific enzyme activase